MQKNWKIRIVYAAVMLLTLLLGLASRKFRAYLPTFVGAYAGDTLWAFLVYYLIRWVWIQASARMVLLLAFLFSFGIEVSQFYHAPWIDALRRTTLGGLVLGFAFLWSDLLCYSVGILGAYLLDIYFLNDQTTRD